LTRFILLCHQFFANKSWSFFCLKTLNGPWAYGPAMRRLPPQSSYPLFSIQACTCFNAGIEGRLVSFFLSFPRLRELLAPFFVFPSLFFLVVHRGLATYAPPTRFFSLSRKPIPLSAQLARSHLGLWGHPYTSIRTIPFYPIMRL